jgi:hypothetical protein
MREKYCNVNTSRKDMMEKSIEELESFLEITAGFLTDL